MLPACLSPAFNEHQGHTVKHWCAQALTYREEEVDFVWTPSWNKYYNVFVSNLLAMYLALYSSGGVLREHNPQLEEFYRVLDRRFLVFIHFLALNSLHACSSAPPQCTNNFLAIIKPMLMQNIHLNILNPAHFCRSSFVGIIMINRKPLGCQTRESLFVKTCMTQELHQT